MDVIYAHEPLPRANIKTLFLAGPTPRDLNIQSWRPEALSILKRLLFNGAVLVPEPRDGKWSGDYFGQLEWEEAALTRADCIVFWVPRKMAGMPGLTTNDEWGTWKASGKVVFGAPTDAESVRYQRYYAEKLKVPNFYILETTLSKALDNLI